MKKLIGSSLLLFVILVAWQPSSVLAISNVIIDATAKISVCGNGVKEGNEQCDGGDLNSVSCLDLGYDAGTINCSIACDFDTTLCSTTAESSGETSFLSSSGGEYTLTGPQHKRSGKITAPPNFHRNDADLRIFSLNKDDIEDTEPAPSGKDFVGMIFKINFVDADGNPAVVLSRPVTITLTYDESDILGLDESALVPYYREDVDTAWHPIQSFTLDTSANTVTFARTNFSLFTIFGAPSSVANGNSDSNTSFLGSHRRIWTEEYMRTLLAKLVISTPVIEVDGKKIETIPQLTKQTVRSFSTRVTTQPVISKSADPTATSTTVTSPKLLNATVRLWAVFRAFFGHIFFWR
jgi:hypothetical protein